MPIIIGHTTEPIATDWSSTVRFQFQIYLIMGSDTTEVSLSGTPNTLNYRVRIMGWFAHLNIPNHSLIEPLNYFQGVEGKVLGLLQAKCPWKDETSEWWNNIYINESQCGPSYWKLLDKYNALFEDKHITSFYTINGNIKIKLFVNTDGEDGEEVTKTISHEVDLTSLFGEETIESLSKRH